MAEKHLPKPGIVPDAPPEGEVIRNNYFNKEFLTEEEALDCIRQLSERALLHERNKKFSREGQKKYSVNI